MCRPEYFEVSYVINPWMDGNIKQTAAEKALSQWEELYQLIAQHAEVSLVAPQPGLPDMPFTANAGLILENQVVLSRFLHPERQGEEDHFENWFTANGYQVYKLPRETPFEGAGDALLDRGGPRLWAGYGYRSSLESHSYLADWLDIEVHSLKLIDDRFYHLDTCFCPLDRGYLLYYPAAFDETSRSTIAQHIPAEKRIAIAEEDARNFACNAVNIENLVILNQATFELCGKLQDKGFSVRQTGLSEFIKAGGSAKCLTLRLDESNLTLSTGKFNLTSTLTASVNLPAESD
jgi:N-dimethylarginine dimethylaminohydrolase